ncbi:MAG TPA: hypothetical protein VJX29_07085 [Candidatus Acidoferrales bacterium]|nr:hypothetical protein [Candidatus Acidoferrales bacterium]
MAFTIVTNGWQPDSQLIESTAAVRSDHEVACRRRAKETVLGDSYLSGEHGVCGELLISPESAIRHTQVGMRRIVARIMGIRVQTPAAA